MTALNDIPRDLWPPVVVVHIAFQIMVAIWGVAGVARRLGGHLVVHRGRLGVTIQPVTSAQPALKDVAGALVNDV